MDHPQHTRADDARHETHNHRTTELDSKAQVDGEGIQHECWLGPLVRHRPTPSWPTEWNLYRTFPMPTGEVEFFFSTVRLTTNFMDVNLVKKMKVARTMVQEVPFGRKSLQK